MSEYGPGQGSTEVPDLRALPNRIAPLALRDPVRQLQGMAAVVTGLVVGFVLGMVATAVVALRIAKRTKDRGWF